MFQLNVKGTTLFQTLLFIGTITAEAAGTASNSINNLHTKTLQVKKSHIYGWCEKGDKNGTCNIVYYVHKNEEVRNHSVQ